MSFNWVIAQYTPAPFPYRAQSEIEEVLILEPYLKSRRPAHLRPLKHLLPLAQGMILICLPLLGAQIGKITGGSAAANSRSLREAWAPALTEAP